jgi:phospholipid/cholesterol/gamma-HCH transport system substrate-binding protein
VQALGDVTDAVGKDGPAIRELVGQLHNLVRTAVQKQDKVRGFVNNLAGFANATADQQQQLANGLKELPSTLDTAVATLDKVRPATEATVPLLNDLRPGLNTLVGVSKDLSPLMKDLTPTLDRLVPTTDAADDLVGDLPGLLNSADDDLPTIKKIVHDYQPAAQFIRPYAPEIAGIFSNWGSTFGAYDSQGHYWPGVVAEGLDGFHDNVTRLPTETLRAEPKPGGIVGQPWDVNDHDATGDGPR